MKKIILILCVSVFVLTACSGDAKPSKESVKKSLSAVLEKEIGVENEDSRERAGDYSECVVDKIYNNFSAKSLKKVEDAKSLADLTAIEGTEKEKESLDNAGDECSDKLLAE